jgi:hypothetical protein
MIKVVGLLLEYHTKYSFHKEKDSDLVHKNFLFKFRTQEFSTGQA